MALVEIQKKDSFGFIRWFGLTAAKLRLGELTPQDAASYTGRPSSRFPLSIACGYNRQPPRVFSQLLNFKEHPPRLPEKENARKWIKHLAGVPELPRKVSSRT